MEFRKEQNMEIIRLLVNYINSNPDQRFGQILHNLNIVDFHDTSGSGFYEEPKEMIKRMVKIMQNKGDENV